MAEKIKVANPVVDLDGDEMTRCVWAWMRGRAGRVQVVARSSCAWLCSSGALQSQCTVPVQHQKTTHSRTHKLAFPDVTAALCLV